MNKLILISVIMVMGMVFTIVPDGLFEFRPFFPFSQVKITAQTYCYFLFEALAKVGFAYIIYAEAKEHRLPLFVFLCLMIAETVDYLLTYNGVWFELGPVPISINTVGITLFALSILYELKWSST